MRLRRLLPAAVALCLGLAASGFLAWREDRSDERHTRQKFEAAARDVVGKVASRMFRYQYGVRSARGAVLAMLSSGDGQVSPRAFLNYAASRDIDLEFPGARGFGFIRRVGPPDVDAYLAAMRAVGRPDLDIKDLGPHEGDHGIIELIEPLAPNRPALGLDILSEARRAVAAESAMRDDAIALSAPITLVQSPSLESRGFLMLAPVYRPGLPVATPAERQRALFGWSYAPLGIDEVLSGLDLRDGEVSLTFFDVAANGTRQMFFRSTGEAADRRGLASTVRLPVFGRQWDIDIATRPGFRQGSFLSPLQVFGLGAGTSALLAALVGLWSSHQRRRGLVRAQNARLRRFLEISEDAVVTISQAREVTSWNAAAERLFGHPAAFALGRKLGDLISADEQQREAEVALEAEVLAGGSTTPKDAQRARRDGSIAEVSVSAAPLIDERGAVEGAGLVFRDISERKAAERGLQTLSRTLEAEVANRTRDLAAAHHDLTTLLDAIPSMVGYWDRELRNRFANGAYRRWFGPRAASLVGTRLEDLLGPALFARNLPFIEGALRGELQIFEREYPRPEGGKPRHGLAYYLPDVIDGEVRGFYVLVHDVSELNESRQRLAAVIRENEALVSTVRTHALYAVTDPRGRILDVNEGVCRAVGVSRDELVGHRFRRLLPAKTSRPLLRAIAETLGRGEAWRGEIEGRAAGGASFWVECTIAAHRDERGGITTCVMIGNDMTARHRADEMLRQATAKAEAASAAKSGFVANMSHEIRTPLNAIIGLSHLLGGTTLGHEQRDYVDKIQVAGRSLLDLVNDVLDFSKIEAGEMDLEEVPFDLHALLEEVELLLTDQAAAKGLALRVSSFWHLPRMWRGDGARVRQILLNLLSNALKFTEKGSVQLEVAMTSSTPPRLLFRVKDTGIGIAPEVRELLFQPFTQADVSTTRRFGGTGLGLSIVRRLVEAMGGEIVLESVPGEGTEFRVRLGCEPLATPGEDQRAAPAVTALIASSEPVETAKLASMVSAFGWQARPLGAGALTTEPSLDGAATSLVLLLDERLPGELMAMGRAWKEAGAVGARAVLLLTGPGQPRGALGQGPRANLELSRPFTRAALFEAMNRALSGTDLPRPTAPARTGAPNGELAELRVLVVDDSAINLKVAQRVLELYGARVLTEDSGHAAVSRIEREPACVELVLMDLQMPGMDGFEATRRIRKLLSREQLPIVALTAGALQTDRQRAFEAGMNDFLTKPLEPAVLIAVLRRHVAARSGTRALPPPVAAPVELAPAPSSTRGAWPEIAGIDGPGVSERLGGDAQLFLSLLDKLLEEFTDLLRARALFEASPGDARTLAARAHRLKGSAGLLGATEVQRAAAAAEHALKTRPEAGEEVSVLLAALAEQLVALRAHAGPVIAAAAPPPFEDEDEDESRTELEPPTQVSDARPAAVRATVSAKGEGWTATRTSR